ncbi:MAG: 1-acyl-sn-glycerol-3-phosphate acyltransferase [Chloroflexi bacterium]|nr:1-acyl-sn-glycerol-3-phosphate acyltransferase [Chloroflexota bacterium]
MSTSVVEAFCFNSRLINAALHIACAPFVLELTRLGLKMESMIARDGDLKRASEWLLDIGAAGIHIHGAENIPLSGPVLFVGNHAGLGDAHSLLMSSPRRDTLLMAHDFGILPGLSQFRRHVIVVEPDRPQGAMRAALRHLRAGGSLLLYPRGEIEADPGLYPDLARESLAGWSRSMTIFARHVPGLAILPVAVGGLISRRALRNPIVRAYRDADRRHFLAATFQMMFPVYRDSVVSVCYGDALYGERGTYEDALGQMSELLRRVGT